MLQHVSEKEWVVVDSDAHTIGFVATDQWKMVVRCNVPHSERVTISRSEAPAPACRRPRARPLVTTCPC